MMKFLVEQVARSGERLGQLELVADTVTATPAPLLATRYGAVPHLTRATLRHVTPRAAQEAPLLASWQHHVKQQAVLRAYGRGLASFMGLPERGLVLTVQDPGDATRPGYHTNSAVSVWCRENREAVTPLEYMEGVAAVMPEVFVALCDGDTEPGCSNKRISKSVSKTINFLDTCAGQRDLTPNLLKTGIIGAVEGGLEIKARTKCAKEVVARNVDAFLLDGFHNNGPTTEDIEFDSFKSVLMDTMALLPEDKPKMYFGASPPALVFKLVRSGVDIFDTTYPYLVTERDSALVFANKLTESVPPSSENAESTHTEMDLSSPEHRNSFVPLVAGCSCYTCRHFTRAYLHHLVTVKEMLARVLLQLHNLHHYYVFFQSLQAAVKEDKVELFENIVLNKL